MVSITEKSGDLTKSYNPTVFNYNETSNSGLFSPNSPATINLSNVEAANTTSVQGDFDGDGKNDLLLYPTFGTGAYQKYWLYKNIENGSNITANEHNIGYFQSIFPISWLGGNETLGYKLAPMQGWCVISNELSSNTTYFKSYSIGSVAPVYLQDIKTYQFSRFTYGYFNECLPRTSTNNSIQNESARVVDPNNPGPTYIVVDKIIPKEFLNGDFNGDGITDIIAVEKSLEYGVQVGCTWTTRTYNGGKTYFINLDRRLTSNYVNLSNTVEITPTSKFIVADVNGDGKSDLLIFDTNRVIVYTLKEDNTLIELFRKTDSGIKLDKPLLMGDYNGDGKLDLQFLKLIIKMFGVFLLPRGLHL